MAAVEARKMIQFQDGALWNQLEAHLREDVKKNLLNITLAESSVLVRHSLAHVISEAAKNELRHQRWGDLIETLYRFSEDQNPTYREVMILI